jgi:hypothetical protein
MNFVAYLKVLLIAICLQVTKANIAPAVSDGQDADIAELPFLVRRT